MSESNITALYTPVYLETRLNILSFTAFFEAQVFLGGLCDVTEAFDSRFSTVAPKSGKVLKKCVFCGEKMRMQFWAK